MGFLKGLPFIIRVMEVIKHRQVKSWDDLPLVSRIFRWCAHDYKDLTLIGDLPLVRNVLKWYASDHTIIDIPFVLSIVPLEKYSNAMLMQFSEIENRYENKYGVYE